MIREYVKRPFFIPWKKGYLFYNEFDQSVQYIGATEKKILEKQLKPTTNVHGTSIATFMPICLTIFPHNRCNLSCHYCYANGGNPKRPLQIDPGVVGAVAAILIPNCLKRKHPLIVGFHGGCEPLLDLELLKKCMDEAINVSQKAGVKTYFHVTTNGVVSEETAREVAQLFDSITISCDGPASVHDIFRKTLRGQPTLNIVERTGQIFLKEMERCENLKVRTTITTYSVHQMEEIVRYLGETWHGLQHLHLEPLYNQGRGGFTLYPEQFVKGFIKARRLALNYGINLIYSGSRPFERHTRFCPILQDNMTITPDGYLTSCFCITERRDLQDDRFLYSSYQQDGNELKIDYEKLLSIQQTLTKDIIHCQECFNQNHCSRGCPEVCPLEEDYPLKAKGHDCRIQKQIAFVLLAEKAGISFSDEDLEQMHELFP